MILYFLIAAVTVLLAGMIVTNKGMVKGNGGIYLSRQEMLNGVGLLFIFTILFGISALRLNVGNDYAKYVEFMHLVVSDAYEPTVVPTEIGFNLVVEIIYGLSGYENFLLVFAFFAATTIGFFLAAIYKQSDHFLFSFFLFMAFGYYFQSFNTVRYYLAVAVALYCIPYVLRKEWVKFIILILLAATLHKSVLVVIPLYIMASWAWNKWSLAIAALFCTTFFFLQDFYLKLVVILYPTYEDTEYLEGGTSYINILRCTGVLIFSLMYYKSTIAGNKRNQFYFYCNLGALVLYTCCSFLPIISRIGYYLTITHVFFLPAIVRGIDNKKWRRLFTGAIVAAGVLYFIMLMRKAGQDGLRILPYETFLFHDMVDILSDVN